MSALLWGSLAEEGGWVGGWLDGWVSLPKGRVNECLAVGEFGLEPAQAVACFIVDFTNLCGWEGGVGGWVG